MKLISFFLRYLQFYSLLLQVPLVIHHSSQIMSSITGFTELVQPTTPPESISPSNPSVPDNTPADDNTPARPLTPQLAIRSVPIEEDELSSIDYQSVVEDPDSAPAGFVHNELEGRHFYPIHVQIRSMGNGTTKTAPKLPNTYSITLTIRMSLELKAEVTPSTPSQSTSVDRPATTPP